jgi:hypothetical protein
MKWDLRAFFNFHLKRMKCMTHCALSLACSRKGRKATWSRLRERVCAMGGHRAYTRHRHSHSTSQAPDASTEWLACTEGT